MSSVFNIELSYFHANSLQGFDFVLPVMLIKL